MKIFFIFIFNAVFHTFHFLSTTLFQEMHQVTRSVVSEVVVYFNFGFSGVNLDSNSISQYALSDLLSHLRRSVTASAFNQEVFTENLTVSKLEIDEIAFVIQSNNTLTEALTNFNFKMTIKVFHKSSSVTTSAFEDIDKITKKMFEKITKTSFVPEFECSPCFIKPDFHAMCIRQHVCGIVALNNSQI